MSMIDSELARQILLSLTALVFLVLAVRTLVAPDKVAEELGYRLTGVNGYSEIFAIYFGLWVASAALATLAAVRIEQALLGDIVALLVLGQPLGRLIAMLRFGSPQGALRAFFALELVGGLLLLWVRPS
jgi:hypothetical protein